MNEENSLKKIFKNIARDLLRLNFTYSVLFRKAKYICISGFFLLLFIILIPNWLILSSTRSRISSDVSQIRKTDAGIILGAAVYSDKRVSHIVNDRIESAVELYKTGKIEKLLISGDHSEKYYDEVNTIKFWLLKNGIPEKDIYMDHAGFSTFESISRSRNVFHLQNAVIITQAFHLPRAVYLAKQYGISAQGFVADQRSYKNIRWFIIREALARVKDFFYVHVING